MADNRHVYRKDYTSARATCENCGETVTALALYRRTDRLAAWCPGARGPKSTRK